MVGALVALRSDAPFHDLDLMVEDEAGMPIADLFATRSEAAFRTIESELLAKALQPGAVVALGGGAQVDDRNWEMIRTRAMTVYLQASLDTIWDRVGGLANRPIAARSSREQLEALLERRRTRYEEADHTVDANRSLDEVAKEVQSLWSG